MAVSVHYIQSMSAYKAISLKKQQKSKYNLCKHQFRGNLKIKNSWISSKRLVGIESNLSQKILLSFLNHKPLSEVLKNFSSIHSLFQLRVINTALILKTWYWPPKKAKSQTKLLFWWMVSTVYSNFAVKILFKN